MSTSAAVAALFDEAIESFERQWAADFPDLIDRVCCEFDCPRNPDLVAELSRVDIAKRYSAGLDPVWQTYQEAFPEVFADASKLRLLAFEDFRSRRIHGRVCPPERWSAIPGIESESWIRPLTAESEAQEIRDSPSGVSVTGDPTLSSVPPGPWPQPPVTLGAPDFEFVALLGTGAFSRVFLARQLSLCGRYVVVKAVTQPLEEASHLARLQHTGIVPLFSCHQADGFWFLCMPYCGPTTLADWMRATSGSGSESRTGQTLIAAVRSAQDRLARAALPDDERSGAAADDAEPCATESDALERWHRSAARELGNLSPLAADDFALWLMQRLSSALAHAHQRGIVHGDLKPANILIRNDGEPALIDFNLSQRTGAQRAQFQGGTPAYMAPEQLTALLNTSDMPLQPSTDVYALGVILFEMTTGSFPWPVPLSNAEVDLAEGIRVRSVVRQFSAADCPSSGLRSIITKCLAPATDQRYPSAVELLSDLEAERNHRPLIYARESFLRSRLPKLAARHPVLFSNGTVLLCCGLVIGMMLLGVLRYRESARRLQALQVLETFQQQSDDVIATFLTADGTRDHTDIRQTSDRIAESVRNLLADQPELSSWEASPIAAHLQAAERREVEERLLAMASLSTHLARSPRDPKDGTGSDGAGSGLPDLALRTGSLLPAWAQSTYAMRSIRSMATGEFPSPTVDDSAVTSQLAGSVDRLLLSVQLLLRRDAARALEFLDGTAAPDSLRCMYWLTRGRAQLETGQAREATASFTMALRELEDSPTIYLNRGLAYLRQRAWDQAAADFSAAIERNPEFVPAYVNRYAALQAAGRPQAGLPDLDRAVLLRPQSCRLRLIRSRALREAGRLRESREDFQLALQHRPETAEDWVSLALARLPDDPDHALRDLETAETLHGRSVVILQSKAHILAEHLNRADEAIRSLDELLQLEPDFQKALGGRAVLHARAGNVDQALRDVGELLRLGNNITAEATWQIACVYALCSPGQADFRRKGIQFLARAVQRGYGGSLLNSDPDIAELRSTPEFQTILQMYHLLADK